MKNSRTLKDVVAVQESFCLVVYLTAGLEYLKQRILFSRVNTGFNPVVPASLNLDLRIRIDGANIKAFVLGATEPIDSLAGFRRQRQEREGVLG